MCLTYHCFDSHMFSEYVSSFISFIAVADTALLVESERLSSQGQSNIPAGPARQPRADKRTDHGDDQNYGQDDEHDDNHDDNRAGRGVLVSLKQPSSSGIC